MFRLFQDSVSSNSTTNEQIAAGVAGTKLYNGLQTAQLIITPLILVIALGLVVWALIGRMYGKTVDGERQKMAKGQFIGILVTGIVLIILASVFATIISSVVLQDKGLPTWFGFKTKAEMEAASKATRATA